MGRDLLRLFGRTHHQKVQQHGKVVLGATGRNGQKADQRGGRA